MSERKYLEEQQKVAQFIRSLEEELKEMQKSQIAAGWVQRNAVISHVYSNYQQQEKVLEKRNGKFPRPISNQRYNEYIKEVCRLAGLTEKVEGKLLKNVTPEDKENPTFRKVEGVYEKYKLVTSHIGRRSFATNYYGRVPTPHLINITGHSSEKMFLRYIKKSGKDIAIDSYSYFYKE